MNTPEHPLAARAKEILKLDPEEAGRHLDALPLEQRIEMLMELPAGRRRQDLVLLSAQPAALARTMPAEDMVLTIKEIGVNDALPLIELSSNEQLTHLLDLELWLQQGLDLGRWDEWLTLLFECGPERVRRWLKHADFEMLVLWAERVLIKLEPEMLNDLPEILEQRVISPDQVHQLAVKVGADLGLVKKLLDLMFQQESDLFFALMGNLGTTPLAELEDLAMRWRQGRLGDRGWPDLDEALAIYAGREPESLDKHALPPRGLPYAPRYPLVLTQGRKLLAQALAHPLLARGEKAQRTSSQLANLINRVLVADGMPAGEAESMRRAGERVAGRLELGLAELGIRDLEAAVAAMQNIPLLHIAQVAQGALSARRKAVLELNDSAGSGWLRLMRSPTPERLAYAARKRPLFLGQDEELPRDFADPQDLDLLDGDIRRARTALELLKALGFRVSDLPSPFPAGSHPESVQGLDCETLLMNAFLQEHAGLPPALLPLPEDKLAQAIAALPADQDQMTRRFCDWASTQAEGLDETAGLADLAGRVSRRLLEQLSGHSPQDVDYRFIEGIWIKLTG